MFLRKIATIRTNNVQDSQSLEKIQDLWQNHKKEMAAAFEDEEPFYAVYHDYASDYKGDYSLSLCRLTDEEDADFDTAEYNYHVYEVEGEKSQGIPKTWQKIW